MSDTGKVKVGIIGLGFEANIHSALCRRSRCDASLWHADGVDEMVAVCKKEACC